MESAESVRVFYRRLSPMVPELFNMAYAICGSCEKAEYALHYALMAAWLGEVHGGVGFHERMLSAVRAAALKEAGHRARKAAASWDELREASEDPYLSILARESAETRRAAALCFGCGLSRARAARLMGLTRRAMNERMDGLERRLRLRNRADPREIRRGMVSAVRGAFAEESASVPPQGAIYRAFAEEATEAARPSRLGERIIKRGILLMLGLLCVAVFWLMAILMAPFASVSEVEPTQIEMGE